MLNKPEYDWASRLLAAGVGATLATSFSVIQGQPPLTTLCIVGFSTTIALLLDEYGIL
jgi:hypothetical protein